ncbi:MAG: DNA primase, partial [Rhodospirillales bacterium]|nr:DNA primase [Rhodospirillales bacterium]
NEKTPSFTVSDDKGFFHCFGCGAHGDAIGFTMRIDNLQFLEAIEKLAGEAGLQVPVATPQERERARVAATLHSVTEAAARWFEQQLRMPHGKAGLDYLRRRGLSDDAIARFRLGFAPDNREALMAALKRDADASDEQLVEAGLVIVPDEGGRAPYDRFRGRVMFPIHDRRGRVIAFGGRVIGDGEPKYLNSPETALFHKGDNLYCLHFAREAAGRDKPVIVAEGYMDAIALQLAGFDGAVAPLGTALTEGQLAILWKLADEPYLCFDGDNAGRRAALRAAERALPLLKPGKSLRFIALPTGEDPDSLIRRAGRPAFDACLAAARPLVEMVWELETDGRPVDTPERRAKIEQALQRRVAEIADETVRGYYRDTIRERLWQSRRGGRGGPAPQGGAPGVYVGARRHLPARPFARGPGAGRFGAPAEPQWFAPGSAAAAGSADQDVARREQRLLGAFLLRPRAMAPRLDELVDLPLDSAEAAELRAALVDAYDGLIAPAAETPPEPLATDALPADARVAAARAQTAARDWMGGRGRALDDAEFIEKWAAMAEMHRDKLADAAERTRLAGQAGDDESTEALERAMSVGLHLARSFRGADRG